MKNKKFVLIPMIVLAIMTVISACSPAAITDIKDITWKWTNLNGSETVVPSPEKFTITFGRDGSLGFKNDCNVGGGSYKLDGSSLTITPGATTLAYCGDQSLDRVFISNLANVVSYEVEEDTLMLKLAGDAGSMTFSKSSSK